ncbi:MAG: hypothetical protein M4D80_36450 [Myxococcota bacterium]|nr:hypothetical protein [Myxococcota bacterium]
MRKTDFLYDPEGDFQCVEHYEGLFADLLQHAQIAGAEVHAEDTLDDDDQPIGFVITIRVDGRVFTFTSENEAREWADVDFVWKSASELGRALGFAVRQVETNDQCAALRVSR